MISRNRKIIPAPRGAEVIFRADRGAEVTFRAAPGAKQSGLEGGQGSWEPLISKFLRKPHTAAHRPQNQLVTPCAQARWRINEYKRNIN